MQYDMDFNSFIANKENIPHAAIPGRGLRFHNNSRKPRYNSDNQESQTISSIDQTQGGLHDSPSFKKSSNTNKITIPQPEKLSAQLQKDRRKNIICTSFSRARTAKADKPSEVRVDSNFLFQPLLSANTLSLIEIAIDPKSSQSSLISHQKMESNPKPPMRRSITRGASQKEIDDSCNRIFDLKISPIKSPEDNSIRISDLLSQMQMQEQQGQRKASQTSADPYENNRGGTKSIVKTRPPPYQSLDVGNTSMEVRYRKYVPTQPIDEQPPQRIIHRPLSIPNRSQGSRSCNTSVNESFGDGDIRFLSQHSVNISHMQENSILDSSYLSRESQRSLKNRRKLKVPQKQIWMNILRKGAKSKHVKPFLKNDMQIIPDDLKESIETEKGINNVSFDTFEAPASNNKFQFRSLNIADPTPKKKLGQHQAATLNESVDSLNSEDITVGDYVQKSLKSRFVLLEKIRERAVANLKNKERINNFQTVYEKDTRTKSVPNSSQKPNILSINKNYKTESHFFPNPETRNAIETAMKYLKTPIPKTSSQSRIYMSLGDDQPQDEASKKLVKIRCLFHRFKDKYLSTNAHYENKLKEQKIQQKNNREQELAKKLKYFNIGLNIIYRTARRRSRKVVFHALLNCYSG